MSVLQDELEKMKAELAASETKEIEEIAPEEPEKEDDAEEAEDETQEKEEEVKEPEKPVEKPEEKKPEVDDAFMKIRREAAAEKKRAEGLQKRLEELEQEKKQETHQVQIEQAPLPPEFQSIIDDHRISRAEREFMMFESKARAENPKYDAVTSEYASALYQSFKVQNPRKSEVELNDMTKKAILIKAGEFARAGYENPVEEIYHEAKGLGFTGKSLQRQESKSTEEKLEPNMKKVAENRKRSAGMAATNGRSEGMMTLKAAAELTSAEWAKLSKADKQRIMYGN